MTSPNRFHTPIKQAKGLGSAKDGTNHWIAQRVSSILLVPLGFLIIIWLANNYQASYSEMVKNLSCPWAASIVFLFIASASYHATLGLQVIIEDYVHSSFWRYCGILKVRLAGYILPAITLFLLIQIMLTRLD